jgi:hypothetical protein
MAQVLLVSPEKIKQFTQVNVNVSEEILLPEVVVSQQIGLQTLLGTKFYDHILDVIQNATYTAAEKTLVDDYIQPYLLFRAYFELLPAIYMRVMNKTIAVGNTEQGSPISTKDLTYLRSIAQDRYQFYSQRLMDYIKNNQAAYPLYYQYTSTDGMRPSRENYFGGIHLPPGEPRKLPSMNKYYPYRMPTYYDPSDYFCG